MKQKPQRKPLTPDQPENVPQLLKTRLLRAKLAVADLIPMFPDKTLDDPELALVSEAATALDRLQDLLLGSQPAWIQDVRSAQRRVDAARLASRSGSPDPGDSPSELGNKG